MLKAVSGPNHFEKVLSISPEAGGLFGEGRLELRALKAASPLRRPSPHGSTKSDFSTSDHRLRLLGLLGELHQDQFGGAEGVDLVLRQGQEGGGGVLEGHGLSGRDQPGARPAPEVSP